MIADALLVVGPFVIFPGLVVLGDRCRNARTLADDAADLARRGRR